MTSEFAIAVHALVYLNHEASALSSEELSGNICTNPARVRKVMAKLKKGGLVGTREGQSGGYRMAKSAREIDLRQVCEALEAEIVKSSWRPGGMDKQCMISSGMAGIMDDIYGEMNVLCKEHLEKITIKDIDGRIFKNHDI